MERGGDGFSSFPTRVPLPLSNPPSFLWPLCFGQTVSIADQSLRAWLDVPRASMQEGGIDALNAGWVGTQLTAIYSTLSGEYPEYLPSHHTSTYCCSTTSLYKIRVHRNSSQR